MTIKEIIYELKRRKPAKNEGNELFVKAYDEAIELLKAQEKMAEFIIRLCDIKEGCDGCDEDLCLKIFGKEEDFPYGLDVEHIIDAFKNN